MADEKRGSLKSEMAKTALRMFGEEAKEKLGKAVRTVREFAEDTAEHVMDRAGNESAFVRFSLRTRAHYDRLVGEEIPRKEAYIRACEEIIEELCKETEKADTK